MAITLYQFPISHYCEKARWALDYKGLDYRIKNLLPGLHLKVTTKMARKSHVPILDHDGVIVQGSNKIISYLDDTFPENKLTPVNPQQAQAALEWERYLDEEVGIHLRRYMYHTLLEHPPVVLGLLTQGSPWFQRNLFKLMFPKVRKLMRKHMQIDAASAAASRQRVETALERLHAVVSEQPFLVGDRFSRADLAACALLAPLFMPVKYGLKWPAALPEPLLSETRDWQDKLAWAKGIYDQYR